MIPTNPDPKAASRKAATFNAKHFTLGNRLCCAWRVTGGIVWMQTRSPRIAAILSQRSDAKLVAYGVQGGYLKTFEVSKGLGWAERFMARHSATSDKTAP